MQMQARPPTQIEATMTACAGACTSYVLQSIANAAGAYEPGYQDQLLRDVRLDPNGSTLLKVERWLDERLSEMQRIGYRVLVRRVAAPADQVIGWVSEGSGHRGAVLSTDRMRLHPGSQLSGSHAVALVLRTYNELKERGVLLVDPWPYMSTEMAPPVTLESAHRARNYAAILLYWSGYA
jgi:hypothetical protein